MKTRFRFVIIIIFYFFFEATEKTNAQAPAWIWATSAGGANDERGFDIATDANGNVFVTGFFWGPSITFDSTTLTNDSAGSPDIFVVKYSPSGNVVWATRAGGTGGDGGYSIFIDAGGNLLVTGTFTSPSISFGSTTLTNAGFEDIFVVKYDASGNVLWARGAGGTGYDEGFDISTDSAGNVFVTGKFSSPSISFGSTTLTNAGNSTADIFVVKYDSSGNALWSTSAGGTGYDYGNGISTDAGGNVYVTGWFSSSSITFGSTTLNNASVGHPDIFVMKYDASGSVVWATSVGGTGNDEGIRISIDAGANVVVTGYFSSPSITFGSTTLTNAGVNDIFVVKYDTSGNVLWATSAGGIYDDYGNAISTDAGGNVFVTGYFNSPSITFGSTTLTNAGVNDIFVVKYDTSGNVLWAVSAGVTDDDRGYGISTDPGGNLFVTGYFRSPSISFGSTTLTNAGFFDMYVAKLDNITGIEENIKNDEVNIFPNPSTNQLAISTRHFAISSVEVYDLMGRLMAAPFHYAPGGGHSGQCSALRVDVSSLSTGIYFVKVRGGKEERIEKFVKE